jgi:hypothetical protein
MKRTELLKLPRLVRSTPAQLHETEPTSFAALRARADEQLKANIVREFTAASSGVRKVVEELDLSGDGEARRDTRAALLKAFRARGVPKKVAEEGLSLLTRSNGFGRVEDPLQPDVPLGRNPLIQNELAEARTILLGKMTRVGAPKIEALLDRGLTVETLNDDALDGLVNAGTLSDADAGRLGLAAAVLRLTDDLDVTDTLVRRRFAAHGDSPAKSLRDLAQLNRADVRSAARAANADLPGCVAHAVATSRGIKKQLWRRSTTSTSDWSLPADEASSRDSRGCAQAAQA